MKDYARSFYKQSMKKTQAAYMSSKHYMCERCGDGKRLTIQSI